MDGSQVKPGITGNTLLEASEVTKGVGTPVTSSTGERAGDHKGHSVLYGGKLTQFAACVNGEYINIPIKRKENINTNNFKLFLNIISKPTF